MKLNFETGSDIEYAAILKIYTNYSYTNCGNTLISLRN